jgi:hypothetical protein
MQSNATTSQKLPVGLKSMPINDLKSTTYDDAEQQFIALIELENLDKKIESQPSLISNVEKAIATAISAAYEQESASDAAHRFLQRVLYRINRLKLFWYDDLQNYTNERSSYLRSCRDRIEEAWQQWELAQLDVDSLQNLDVAQTLTDWVEADVDPPISENGRFFRDEITEAGYRRLLAIGSLDGLVEASQLSRTLGGVANEVQSTLTRLLLEEYGGGRLARKHSTFFTQMLDALGMETEPEAYLDLVPWEVLATINYSFLLTERKRYFLRYMGGTLYFEVTVPAGFRPYRAAAERLELPPGATSYWDLHIKVDALHGRWMLEDVALPLVEQYPADAWELLLGYDHQRRMSDRASNAVVRAARQAEQETIASHANRVATPASS